MKTNDTVQNTDQQTELAFIELQNAKINIYFCNVFLSVFHPIHATLELSSAVMILSRCRQQVASLYLNVSVAHRSLKCAVECRAIYADRACYYLSSSLHNCATILTPRRIQNEAQFRPNSRRRIVAAFERRYFISSIVLSHLFARCGNPGGIQHSAWTLHVLLDHGRNNCF